MYALANTLARRYISGMHGQGLAVVFPAPGAVVAPLPVPAFAVLAAAAACATAAFFAAAAAAASA